LAETRTIVSLVVDCNVVAKWELPAEDYTAEAMELFQDWQANAVSLYAPDLLPSEIGSVFLRAVRRNRITVAEAEVSIQNLLNLDFNLQPSRPLVPRAFEIALQHNQRIYDCFYVAVAEREGVDLWTSDERLFNALNTHFPFVRFIRDYMPLR
jgi:predicted nucleic acid-binding protein